MCINSNFFDSLSFIPPLPGNVAFKLALNEFSPELVCGECILLKESSGKLMVYTSDGHLCQKRLESVSAATRQTAKMLNLNFEVIKLKGAISPIYVYYGEGGADPIPLYCDEGKMSDLEEIGSALRCMMFVLSFHPQHPALQRMRKEIVKLS